MSAETPPWLKLLQSRAGKVVPAERATRRELWIAAILLLVACAIPVGSAIFGGSRIFFALDTTRHQEPWTTMGSGVGRFGPSSGPPTSADRAPDPLLVEQGCRLYPAWRYTAEELAAQRLPTWNPSIGAGVPWLADPHAGVLDPQVMALGVLEVIGGNGLFERGLAWTAWLRLAAAAFGAYVLARRVGLTSASGALAAAGFAGSAACLVSVNMPEGHVAAIVPWLLVAIDRLRDRATLRRVSLVALATAFLVMGGDVETAFFAGCTAIVWTACALEGRARWLAFAGLALGTLACAPFLLPFLEALERSQVLVERRALAATASHFDFIALGLVVVTCALVAAWRALDPGDQSGARGLAGTVGVVFALCTCAFVASGHGLGAAGRALFLYDAHGSLGTVWRGKGAFSETIVAWVPAIVVALAMASFFSLRGTLHARKAVQVVALCALLLAIGMPGVVDVWHRIPFFGLGAPAKAAAAAALFVSLLAGEALDAAPRAARRTAGIVFVALVSLCLVERNVAPKLAADPTERYFAWTDVPPSVWTNGTATVAGYITDELPSDALTLRARRVAEDGGALEGPLQEGRPYELGVQLDPSSGGRRTFRSKPIDVTEFSPGTWRFSLDVERRRADGNLEVIGSRDIAFSKIAPEPRMSALSMVFTVASFLVLLFVAGAPSRWKWCAVALAALQPLWMSSGLLPTVERGPGFDLSQTERIVQEQLGAHRVVTGWRVFPGETGLIQRIPIANAAAPLGSHAFAQWWQRALKPGSDPVLGVDAKTVDVTSSAFQLLGVSMLTCLTHVDAPGFELIAGMEPLPRWAQAFVYRAHAPMPRAFCVTRILEPRDVAARDPLLDPSFDPKHTAFLDEHESWRPSSPATTTRVELGEGTSDRVKLTATVDGDALLVLTDEVGPGWSARVDGLDQRVLTVDGLFLGVPLPRGAHAIELEYAPASLQLGGWIALAALIAIAVMFCVPRRLTTEVQPA